MDDIISKKETVIIRREWLDAIITAIPSADERAEAYTAIMEYAFGGAIYEGASATIKMLFALVRPAIDRANESYAKQVIQGRENGYKGGRPRKNQVNNETKEVSILHDEKAEKIELIFPRIFNRTRNTKMKYDDQLKDERWYAFRDFVFAVRGNQCEKCGSEKNLQVHHPHYVSGRKAWEYTCNEVVVLCSKCHQQIHKIK